MDWKVVFEGVLVVGCLVTLIWLGVELERRGVLSKIRRGLWRLFGVD